jgi:putative oxidoreductase
VLRLVATDEQWLGVSSRGKISDLASLQLGHGFWGFSLKSLSSYGCFSMAHEARTDFCMLLGSLFLLIVGSGPWALDQRLSQRLRP